METLIYYPEIGSYKKLAVSSMQKFVSLLVQMQYLTDISQKMLRLFLCMI